MTVIPTTLASAGTLVLAYFQGTFQMIYNLMPTSTEATAYIAGCAAILIIGLANAARGRSISS